MTTDSPPGLYIHVPFCKTKCNYCDFYSVTADIDPGEWTDAALQEADRYHGMFRTFDTLYIGGGTPSLPATRHLRRLLTSIRDILPFHDDAEITVEANPDDVDENWLKMITKSGVNRVSLGIQSLDDGFLRFLGRRHTAADCITVLDLLESFPHLNRSVDLIYCGPDLTETAWRKTLEIMIDRQPEHISCYQLTLVPGTPLHNRMIAGEFAPPDEKTASHLFQMTAKMLTAAGYIHYEISNFARRRDLMSRHNRKYWDHTPYLGLGPAAHSFRENHRWWNIPDINGYMQALRSGQSPVSGEETLAPEQLRMETVMLGFRTMEGVHENVFDDLPGADATIDYLLKERFITRSGDRILPTAKGWLLADRIPVLFFRKKI